MCVDSTGYDNEVQVDDELEVICTASYTACSCSTKKWLFINFSLASHTTCS